MMGIQQNVWYSFTSFYLFYLESGNYLQIKENLGVRLRQCCKDLEYKAF